MELKYQSAKPVQSNEFPETDAEVHCQGDRVLLNDLVVYRDFQHLTSCLKQLVLIIYCFPPWFLKIRLHLERNPRIIGKKSWSLLIHRVITNQVLLQCVAQVTLILGK